MPSYPDEPLPELQLSLKGFNDIAYNLLDYSTSNRVDPMHHRFVNFVLAGRYRPHLSDQEWRVSIDVHKGLTPTDELENITITRDYDSVIGITTKLPFRTSIALCPIPNFAFSLKKSNHLVRTIQPTVSESIGFKCCCRCSI